MTRRISIADYSYHLPQDRIARYPLEERDQSRLLVYDKGRISHCPFHELPALLPPGMLMVMNDTRVIQARLSFKKQTGSRIEIFCVEPHEPSDYQQAFRKMGTSIWKCLVGNARKWKQGFLEKVVDTNRGPLCIRASREGRDQDAFLVRFSWQPEDLAFGNLLELAGSTPIPPYLGRESVEGDRGNYQTVYSRVEGSVAAPTAGLHFTDEVLKRIGEKGIGRINLTLHVGAGTFQPVGSGGLECHPMHAERFHVSAVALQDLINQEKDILAVGTTTTRMLESLYWLGCKIRSGSSGELPEREDMPLYLDQWEYNRLRPLSRKQSLCNLFQWFRESGRRDLEAITRLMIIPGYTFRMTDAMITNFHLPKSTLLLLVGAFIGKDWRKVYSYAMNHDFRFLSYGDSSILFPHKA